MHGMGPSAPLVRHAMAYVLAGGRGSRLMELTNIRAKPAVYFGGKSRIIDFALSNALNSGIRRIGVATQYKAHSLIRHLQRGWNFFRPERNETFDILPASQRIDEAGWYAGTADAVYQNIDIIESYDPRYIVLLAGDHIYKMDYGVMLQQHVDTGADVTVACIEVPRMDATGFGVMHVDAQDRITSFLEKPADPPGIPGDPDHALASMGVYVFETRFLLDQLRRDAADLASAHDFGKDVIPHIVAGGRAVAHRFAASCVRSASESAPYWRDVGTVDAYWEANIDLTDFVPGLDLYDRDWPIWTYAEILPPAKFIHDESLRRGQAMSSLVSGGCIVSGSTVAAVAAVQRGAHAFVRQHRGGGDPALCADRAGARLRDVVVDRGVKIPPGLVVGEDAALDAARFRRTPRGVCLITQAMVDALDAPVTLRVLSVASEMFPLVKTGGLADVVGALPAALAGHGVEMRTLLPGYPGVMAAVGDEPELLSLPLMGGAARVLAAGMVMVLDAPHLFDRAGGPYGGPAGDWPDNPQRFAALCQAAAVVARGGLPGWRPDLVHAHDWQAGLVPAYLRYGVQPACPTVFTVHNLAFQGWCPAGLLAELGLPPESFTIEGVEFYGGISPLKAGLRLADRVTTVSPTYAAEITRPEEGQGLDGLLRARRGALSGIVNGIDTAVWDPARDPLLPARYRGAHARRRGHNREALLAAFGLEAGPGPVFGVVSRLTRQKGIDLVLEVLPELVAAGARLVVLGTGEAALEQGLAAARSGRVGVRIGYDEGLAHLVQAGCDALLVPSRFEPCGLTQLCALRYGAIPVVSRVGGLADTVVDANPAAMAAGVATGVQFLPADADGLRSGLQRALALFGDAEAWERLQRNAMRAEVGWTGPAKAYSALYHELVTTKGATSPGRMA